MHGVRRAEVQLGDTACVIGLGLVGQLVVRLLVASGVRVVGLDVVEDRCRLAEQAGALLCAAPTDEGLAAVEQALAEITGGRGADHVFLAAGGSSNGPVEAAARLARDRARVVDIGKTQLDLPWNAYYDKELDVRFSRSYGPGRYDDRYELEGIDYPAGYVRWTERRNLECFLDLIARKEIEVESLVSGVFPLEQATDRLRATWPPGRWTPSGSCSSTQRPAARTATARPRSASWSQAAARPRRAGRAAQQLAVGFIGAGNYASSMLLPAPGQARGRSGWPTWRPPGRCRRSTRSAGSASRPPRPRRTRCSRTTSLDAIFIVTRHTPTPTWSAAPWRPGRPSSSRSRSR